MKVFSYKVVDLDIAHDAIVMASNGDSGVRKSITDIINTELNSFGEDGWRLHTSGLSALPTIILEKEREDEC